MLDIEQLLADPVAREYENDDQLRLAISADRRNDTASWRRFLLAPWCTTLAQE